MNLQCDWLINFRLSLLRSLTVMNILKLGFKLLAQIKGHFYSDIDKWERWETPIESNKAWTLLY